MEFCSKMRKGFGMAKWNVVKKDHHWPLGGMMVFDY